MHRACNDFKMAIDCAREERVEEGKSRGLGVARLATSASRNTLLPLWVPAWLHQTFLPDVMPCRQCRHSIQIISKYLVM